MYVLVESEEGVEFPGTKVRDACEPLCECWELNSSPLQQVLLTTEPLLWPLNILQLIHPKCFKTTKHGSL